MDRAKQESYRAILLTLRARFAQAVNLAEQALREDAVKPGDVSHLPTHPADQDTEGVDEQITIAQVEEGMLEAVEAALARIDQGTFGTCQSCRREIAAERLRAIPYAPLCIDCARKQDATNNS